MCGLLKEAATLLFQLSKEKKQFPLPYKSLVMERFHVIKMRTIRRFTLI